MCWIILQIILSEENESLESVECHKDYESLWNPDLKLKKVMAHNYNGNIFRPIDQWSALVFPYLDF